MAQKAHRWKIRHGFGCTCFAETIPVGRRWGNLPNEGAGLAWIGFVIDPGVPAL